MAVGSADRCVCWWSALSPRKLKGHLFWHTLLTRGFHPIAADASCLSEMCWQRQGETATCQGERMEGKTRGLWRESLCFKALRKRSKSAVILNVVDPSTLRGSARSEMKDAPQMHCFCPEVMGNFQREYKEKGGGAKDEKVEMRRDFSWLPLGLCRHS